MSDTVIQIESLSKYYRLGVVSSGTISHDLNRWWARFRGKPDPTLRVDQVEKKNKSGNSGTGNENGYDDFIWALRDINLEVRQGEVLGIIGRNGAGKSTLLKILSRVTAPTTGECRIKGRIASLLEVGTGFHPELTGRENIFLNGAILGMSKYEIRGKFDEIVAFSEVEKYIDTPVKRYSSGMYVRLAFAVAAHLEPEILVVDEVLAVGDAEFQKKCLGKMNDVATQGRTILFVSHNMGAINILCKKGVLLEGGQIAVRGSASEAISKYQTINSGSCDVDLSIVNNRIGNGYARFIKVLTRNQREEICDNFVIGDDLIFDINILCEKKIRFARMSLHIKSSDGIPIYHFHNIDAGFELTDLDGQLWIRITLKKQKIYPGEYHVNLWLGDMSYEYLDYIQNAMKFMVIEGGIVLRRPLDRNAGVVHEIPLWEKL